MTPSESPPPYAPRDPLLSHSPERRTSPELGDDPHRSSVSLRGGYLRPVYTTESDSVLSPTAYFEERNFQSDQIPPLTVLDVDIHPGTTRDELPFPLSPEDSEARNITDQDWETFVNYLLTELGSDELSGGNEKGRRWGAMNPEEFFQAKIKMETIVGEWNEAFFMPRGIHFNAKFSFAPPSAPSSSQADAQEPTPSVVASDGAPAPASAPIEQTRSAEELPCEPPHWGHGHPGMMHNRGTYPGPFMGMRGRGMYRQPHMHPHSFGPHPPTGPWGMGPPMFRGRRPGLRGGYGHAYPRRHRSRSSSTSSSSSSSSSDSSVSSISASSIAAADASQVRDAIAVFRTDPTRKSHLKLAVEALHKTLRQKHKEGRRSENSCSRSGRADFKENKRSIKQQLRELKDEVQAIRRDKKNERREKKKVRKAEKRAAKEQRRADRRRGSSIEPDDVTLVDEPHFGKERDILSGEGEMADQPHSPSSSDYASLPHLRSLSKSDRKLEAKALKYDHMAAHWDRQATHWQGQADHYTRVYADQNHRRQEYQERMDAWYAIKEQPGNAAKAEKLAQKRAKQLQKLEQTNTKYAAKAEEVSQKIAQQRVKAEQTAADFRKKAAETRAKMQAQAPAAESARDLPGNQQDQGTYFETIGKRIGTWGEQFGRDMETWGDQFGREMGDWGERVGRDWEAWGENFERNVEGWGRRPG